MNGPNDYPTSPNDEAPDTERGGGGADSIDNLPDSYEGDWDWLDYDSVPYIEDPDSDEAPGSC